MAKEDVFVKSIFGQILEEHEQGNEKEVVSLCEKAVFTYLSKLNQAIAVISECDVVFVVAALGIFKKAILETLPHDEACLVEITAQTLEKMDNFKLKKENLGSDLTATAAEELAKSVYEEQERYMEGKWK